MKFSIKPDQLKYLTLGCGALGLALRYTLYATGTDARGLLISFHWSAIALWLLTAVVLVGLVYLTRSIDGPGSCADCFPCSAVAWIGCIVGGFGTAIATVLESGTMPLLCNVLSYLAALLLLILGVCRLLGIGADALLHGALCLYFALRMVFQYRSWSSDPQLMDYCFQLFACVGLMLAAYHQGAFAIGLGSHKKLWFWTLLTTYLCCLTPVGPGNSLLFVACGIWIFTNLSVLHARPRRRKPALNLDPED